jgi:phage tail-like protein
MAILRDQPYRGSNFTVDIGTGETEGSESDLVEVVFPEARIQISEYRNGNDKVNEPIRIHSLTHYGNLILKRGALGSLTWYQWWNDAGNGNPGVARTVVVHLLNEDHTEVVLTWKFVRAQPTNYQYSALKALVCDTLIESLELAFERLEIE